MLEMYKNVLWSISLNILFILGDRITYFEGSVRHLDIKPHVLRDSEN